MARPKKVKDTAGDVGFFEDLANETGSTILSQEDSVHGFVDTGNLALNYINSGKFIKGGFPLGKMIEIFGPSSSSKTLVGSNVLFGIQKLGGIAVLIDAENASNQAFMQEVSHVDTSRLIKFFPRSLEQAFAKIAKIIEFVQEKKGTDVPILFLYDSLTVSGTERELKELDLPENPTKEQIKKISGHEKPGERAAVCSKELRKLNSLMSNGNVTVIFLNQIRNKIGIAYGNPELSGGGGNALTYYVSNKLRLQTQKKIEKKLIGKNKKILGINLKMENKKNRSHSPFKSSDNIPLYFEAGIHPLGGLLNVLLDAKRIEGSGGNFTVKEPWCGSEPVKFKASAESNMVPLETLYQCPALIDAESKEEIEEYLKPYQNALNYKLEGEIIETSIDEGDDSADAEIDNSLE